LSVCAAAADPIDVDLRLEQFPDASAEDMEGFGFAFACHQAGVPAHIIRGISNTAGVRDRAEWCIDEAAQSAARLFLSVLQSIVC
jgi:futalosine hydrolase